MKQVKKFLKSLASKMLNLFIVFLLLFQPIGTPGMIALAEEVGGAVAEESISEPVAETEEPAEEAPVEEAASIVEEPAPAETPVVETETPVAGEATSTENAPVSEEETQGRITPEAASIENPVPVVEETPVAEAQKDAWSKDGDKATTNDPVELEKTYVAPQNDQVSVKFTKLPENPGTLSIEEINLTDEQVASFNALSNKAYDITSSMENGTFEFDLTLPKTDDSAVGISYIEKSVDELENVTAEEVKTIDEDDVDVKDDTVEATAIDHFTIFFTVTLNGTTITVTPHEYLQGQTVYVKADGISGFSNYYRLFLKPVTANEFSMGSCVRGPFMGSSSISASYNLPANAETGTWTAELYRFSNSSCTNDKTAQQSPWPTFTVNAATTESTPGNNAGVGMTSGGSGTEWTNTNNITADDNSYATANLGNRATSEYLQGTNYGFAIPNNAIINGITVSIMRQSSSNSGNDSINDDVVQLIKGGTRIGDDKSISSDWPTTMAIASYEGDLWGTSWTPADINASNFGVALSVRNQSSSNRTASVDYMQIAVTYSIETSLPSQTITVTSSAPVSAEYGSTFPVAATASSALPVAITATGGCSILSDTVTMTSGTTSCVVHYNQAGNGSFGPAPEVPETVTASKKAVTVTADNISKAAGDVDPVLTYQITSGTLAGTDLFTGVLSRVTGETIGTYAINQGTLSLSLDNYALTYVPGSFTIDGTPYVPVDGNVIQNPSFEDGSGNNADKWTTNSYGGNGGNHAEFSIVAGHSGSRAGQINMTLFNDGDAKWVHQAVPVAEGEYYNISFWYKSTADAQVDFLYNGSNWNEIAKLPTASNWTEYKTDLLVPVGVTSVQILPLVTGNGLFTSDDFSMVKGDAPVFGTGGMVSISFDDGTQNIIDNALPILKTTGLKSSQYINTYSIQGGFGGYMTPSEVSDLYVAGHDIGAHSSTHPCNSNDPNSCKGLVGLNPTQLSDEINDNRDYIKSILPSGAPVDSFAYPFGEYDDAVITAVKGAAFQGGRTVDRGYNFTNTDKFKLKVQEVDGNTTVDEAKGWIGTAKTEKAWLILLFHDIRDASKGETACPNLANSYCANKDTFEGIITYLKAQNMTVPTVSQGLAIMYGASIPDTIPPVLTEKTIVPVLTNDATPSYTFTSTEAGTITYAGDCASVTATAVAGDNIVDFNTLIDGAHTNCTIQVADAAGNISLALPVTAFTVDATLPVVTIASAIDGTAVSLPLDGTANTKSNALSVTFSAADLNGSVTNLDCMLDAGTYSACTSPVAYTDLLDGIHTLSVRATDTAGNLGTSIYTWVVDNTKPEITLLGLDPVTVQYGSVYTDAGATALDNVIGDMTNSIITLNPVNTSLLGTYTVTYNVMDVTGNVADQKTRTVNVVPADQVITFDAITEKTYGDIFTASVTGGASGEPVILTARLADPVTIFGKDVTTTGIGEVIITATQAGNANYNAALPVSQTFNITKQAITATADAQSKGYGETDPTLTYKVTTGALKSGDAFTGSLTRDAGENKGDYAINQGTLALGDNYNLTYVGANLTIGIKAVEVEATAKTKIYGDSEPALTFAITKGALKSGDSFSGYIERVAGEDVGTYAIGQGTLSLPAENYTLKFSGANFTINPRELKVTADNQSKTMNDDDPILTFSINSGILQFGQIFSIERAAGETPGEYAINQSSMSFISNYLLDYIGGIFTIYEFPPVISNEAASNPSKSSVTITWTTDHPATSRVVYDTVSRLADLTDTNYGYAHSTVETDNAPKVTSHSVTLTGLSSGTQYFFRTVSHGSPETVSDESSFITDEKSDDDDDDDKDSKKKKKKKSAIVSLASAYVGRNISGGMTDEAVSGEETELSEGQIAEGMVKGEENAKDISLDETSPATSGSSFWFYIIGAIILLAAIYYVYRRKNKKTEDPTV